MTWAAWFEKADRTVCKSSNPDKTIDVSTVFLGLDHRFGEGPPLLFETMVFGGPLDQECERYTTWDEAIAGHEVMVNRAMNVATKKEGI